MNELLELKTYLQNQKEFFSGFKTEMATGIVEGIDISLAFIRVQIDKNLEQMNEEGR